MRLSSKLLLLLALPTMLSACATDRPLGGASDVRLTNLDALPAVPGDLAYRIGPQEKLRILVVGAEELSGEFLTDELGNLSYPLLGELPIAGKFPSDASRMLEDGLRGRFLLDPQVRVVPQELPAATVSVGGQVSRPGSYPADESLTLLRAVNQAEGLGEFAKLDDVVVMRAIEGQSYIGVYNIRAIQRGNYPDPRLYPNDVVMVGDSKARRRLDTILQLVPLLSTSAILVDRLGR